MLHDHCDKHAVIDILQGCQPVLHDIALPSREDLNQVLAASVLLLPPRPGGKDAAQHRCQATALQSNFSCLQHSSPCRFGARLTMLSALHSHLVTSEAGTAFDTASASFLFVERLSWTRSVSDYLR
jgi:hypothetical protein